MPHTVHAGVVTVRLTAFLLSLQQETQSQEIFAMVTGHQQFSSVVTQSWSVFRRSQAVTPATGLSSAHIGVATP